MGVMDTAGNLITLGVAYKMTDNLLSKTSRRRSCKKKRK
jgi:hypothetical protein